MGVCCLTCRVITLISWKQWGWLTQALARGCFSIDHTGHVFPIANSKHLWDQKPNWRNGLWLENRLKLTDPLGKWTHKCILNHDYMKKAVLRTQQVWHGDFYHWLWCFSNRFQGLCIVWHITAIAHFISFRYRNLTLKVSIDFFFNCIN